MHCVDCVHCAHVGIIAFTAASYSRFITLTPQDKVKDPLGLALCIQSVALYARARP